MRCPLEVSDIWIVGPQLVAVWGGFWGLVLLEYVTGGGFLHSELALAAS